MSNPSIASARGRYGEGMSTRKVAIVVAVLWVCAMFVQSRIDIRRHYYNPILNTPGHSFLDSLRNNMFGASMLGFREVAAGMLWVKADELFHEGKYQELVPYFSLVTFMDPHQVDVYSTGAWHLMYNFGDARMVPQGMAFLDEGIANNRNVWDLYFQKGWSMFDWPVENYDGALPLFRAALLHNGMDGTAPPRYIAHMVAHCLVRMNRLDEAKAQWRDCIAKAETEMANAKRANSLSDQTYWQQERDVCRMNLSLVTVRQAYRRSLPQHLKTITVQVDLKNMGPRILGMKCRLTGIPVLHDTGGDVTNARTEIVVQDKDYDKLLAAHSKDFAWIGKHLTRLRTIYNIVESDGRILSRKAEWIPLDLSKDTTLDPPRKPEDLFPLESKQYEVIVRLDPRVRRQPEAVQDELGWVGEGIAPGKDVIPGPDNGRIVEKRIVVPREMIAGK
jgi:hypothetical protein